MTIRSRRHGPSGSERRDPSARGGQAFTLRFGAHVEALGQLQSRSAARAAHAADGAHADLRAELRALEHVLLDDTCFVARSARLFAEPHRAIRVGPLASIAADAFLHGPIELGAGVSINAFAVLDHVHRLEQRRG